MLLGFIRIRYVFAILGFILFAIIYGLKVNMSVAIVAMTVSSSGTKNNVVQSDCTGDLNGDSSSKHGTFKWGEDTQGIILSSYFSGYLVSQVPGGRMAEIMSAKWILFGSAVLNIIPSLLTPAAAELHWSALIVLRIIEGVGGGVTFPAMHVMISKWSPIDERSLMSGIIYAGTAIGSVISLLFTGFIIEYINWQASFYIMGSLSSIWCALWLIFITDNPYKNHFMSDEERDYIVSSLGENTHHRMKHTPVPWKHVWTSRPFYAILVAHVFNDVGWYMLLIETPIYYKQVLKFSIRKITIASSIPFFTLWLLTLSLGAIQSKLIAKKIISVLTARKIATLIASAIPAICIVGVNLAGCEEIAIIILLGTGITCMGAMFSGFLSNHIDIAPNFSGTLMGVTNSAASVPGIIVPIIVGHITKKNQTRQRWSIVHYSSATFLALEAVVFTMFASGEEQPWNNPTAVNEEQKHETDASDGNAKK